MKQCCTRRKIGPVDHTSCRPSVDRVSMKFKWKLAALSTFLGLCIVFMMGVHQAQQTNIRHWALLGEDNVVQPRAQKSGEEKNYVPKQIGAVVSPPNQVSKTTDLHHIIRAPNFLNITKQILPWIDRKIYLSNYFTSNLTEDEKLTYRNSVIIYLHHNKAAGTTTKKCMQHVIPKSGKKLGPVMASANRMSISKRLSLHPQNRYNVYMGGYSFGLCDDINQSCSYFTIFRDPFQRSLSSFSYCRRARSDQLCRAQSPWKVTLKEWTIHQGSFLFRQLLFHPKFCSEFKNNFKPYLLPHDIYGSIPCWFRQKVIMFDLLSKSQIDALVDFCINNIEKWFAVVGLTEEYDTSLAMLQQVYGVPFSSCAGSVQNTSGRYTNISNNKNETLSDGHAQMVDELMNDEDVQRALYADIRLYNKIKEIFYKQKEKMDLLNKIS
ncbi:uncharacterized protein [Antedon mediterranea]|uniref:uncharacterized protein n=1 Tax=Antedon mediterranea TaxID=105859 RepID=UPI003AF7C408